ncbi:MAG: hypothetical protein WCK32_02335 [Chlorobiaceae bacterium]
MCISRKNDHETWLSTAVIKVYQKLYRLGSAHNAETWYCNELAGGL